MKTLHRSMLAGTHEIVTPFALHELDRETSDGESPFVDHGAAHETDETDHEEAGEADESAVFASFDEAGFEGEIDAQALGIPPGMLTPSYTAALSAADVVSPHVHVRWGLYAPDGKGAFSKSKAADPHARVKRVVIHVLEADFKGVVTRWHTQAKDASIHYVVGKKGAIAQLCAEHLEAWHATSANGDSIGIEHDGHYDSPANYTEAMLRASARLVEDICFRHRIPINRRHIVGHDEVFDSCHGDPGRFFDWDYYLGLVRYERALREGKTPAFVLRVVLGGSKLAAPWKRRKVADDAKREKRDAWLGTHAAPAASAPTARFVLPAMSTGFHDVSLWFVPFADNTSGARVSVTVGKAAKPAFVIALDQKQAATRKTCAVTVPVWRSMGAVWANAGELVTVELSAAPGAKGNLVVDAVRFLKTDRVVAGGLLAEVPEVECFSKLNAYCVCKSCAKKKTQEERDACFARAKVKASDCGGYREALKRDLASGKGRVESEVEAFEGEVDVETEDFTTPAEAIVWGEVEQSEAHEPEAHESGDRESDDRESDDDEARYRETEWFEADDHEVEDVAAHEARLDDETCCKACQQRALEAELDELDEAPRPAAPAARKQRHNTKKELLARWSLATGDARAPTFHALIDLHKPAALAKVPTALLVAFSTHEAGGFGDATHGRFDKKRGLYHSPAFYELGAFQVPAGLHGTCTGKSASSCRHAVPGQEDPKQPSSWAKHAKKLGVDPKRWDDPETQTRIGLAYVAEQLDIVKRKIVRTTPAGTFEALFPVEGSSWYLAALVLLPHVGVGTASRMLVAHKDALLLLPEDARWAYLSRVATSDAETSAIDNVEPKMTGYLELAVALAVEAASAAAHAVVGAAGRVFR